MADHRKIEPDTLLDRITWRAAVIGHYLLDIPRLVTEATRTELVRLVVAAVFMLSQLISAVAGGFPALAVLGSVAWAYWLIWEMRNTYRAIADREQLVRALEASPSGAPRIANVKCSRGFTHRFQYGPTGWEEIGPVVPEPVAS